MKCTNCENELTSAAIFCLQCGEKNIKHRITIKSLFSDVILALGWDSKFFITVRDLFIRSQTILNKYLNGTKQKYANPFTFFAIGAAISLLAFNQFSSDYLTLSSQKSDYSTEVIDNTIISGLDVEKEKIPADFKQH